MSDLLPLDPLHFSVVVSLALCGAIAAVSLRPLLVVRHPRATLLGLAGVTLLAFAAMVRVDPPGLRLVIDPSTEPLLPWGDPDIATYRQAIRDFGDDQMYVIAMETQQGVFSQEHLSALRRVRDRVSRLPGVRAAQSLVGATTFGYSAPDDWIEVKPFLEEIPSDPAALDALRERALHDPLYLRTLVSADGRAAALNVTFREMTDGEFIASDLDGRIAEILRDETSRDRAFHVSGRPHIKAVMYRGMVRDLEVLVPAVFAVVTAVLLPLAGSLRGVLLPLINVGVGVIWTFGGVAALGRPLSVLTVLLAPALLATGSVFGVHVIGGYEEEAAHAATPAEAMGRAQTTLIAPVLISGITTAIGFGSLCITDVPAVFELGAFSVLGVASVTLLTMAGVPAVLALLPLRKERRAGLFGARAAAALDTGLLRLTAFSRRNASAVIFACAAVSALGVALVPRIVVDTDYLSFFDADTPVRRDFERVNALLSGAVPLFVVLDGGSPGALREPDNLRAIERLQGRLDALPGVSHTTSFLDTLRVLNRALSRDDPAQERVPDSRAAIAELLFMLPKADLQRFATVDQQSANLIVRTGAVGSASMRALGARIDDVLSHDTPPGFTARVTGNALLLTRAADGVAGGQASSLLAETLAIFALMSWSLRSFSLGFMAMVPNLVPVAIFFGMLGAGVATLSLPSSLIAVVSLGLAIDSTAHFLFHYREYRRAGATPDEAVASCVRALGRPIAIAETMLCVGFAAVAASHFATLREFGILTSISVGVCLICNLMLLPALLVRLKV
ncbi:MAG TPA: MMPL family transporter [Myxococcota bacterium]|nr:MMPL family transporter [Myxococcota bacterium]